MCPNVKECMCPKETCPNHGKCCDCVKKHRDTDSLPFCLFPDMCKAAGGRCSIANR